MALRKMTADEFVQKLAGFTRERDKRFAFFLGAGCSVGSGIADAGYLVRDNWLPRLRDRRARHRSDMEKWAAEQFPRYSAGKAAAYYGAVMEELFPFAEERQRELEDLCKGCFPGFGYAVVASLMAIEDGCFNVALTTNFDDLIADALYLFTKSRPLVIPHESLAAYIRPTRTRPLVVKLHGDHRLSPQNTTGETAKLKRGIERQVRALLHDRGLIFMGYGGNDRGILRMLKALPREEALPLGVYWVSAGQPPRRFARWLESRGAFWVQIEDFDELMVLIKDVCDLPHPDRRRFEKVFDRYAETYQKISGRIESIPDTRPEAPTLKKAAKRVEESFPDWWAVELAASRVGKTNPKEAERVYEEGLERFPNSANLVGNYAVFLEDVRKDHDKAEEMYRRALEADPNHANNLGNYAFFLENVRKDYDKAEETYRRALEADPNHANHLGNYAVFLENVRKDYYEAEEMYRRALQADPNHANNLNNYAAFLEDVPNDYDKAEEMYRRALKTEPNGGSILGNYAGFLLARGRQDEGLPLLERVLGMADLTERADLAPECWFYAFAHRPAEERPDALANLKRFLVAGGRSRNWDLSRNVERARQDGHPDVEWLEKVAQVINEKADISILDEWDKWREIQV
jgi:Tfp pilus assembly protein PilF